MSKVFFDFMEYLKETDIIADFWTDINQANICSGRVIDFDEDWVYVEINKSIDFELLNIKQIQCIYYDNTTKIASDKMLDSLCGNRKLSTKMLDK